jgi:hypothetical protein
MGINSAIDAELAYRRERITQHYRPWRRVGTERRSSRAGSDTARRAATSVVTVSR